MKTAINITVDEDTLKEFDKLGYNRSQFITESFRSEILKRSGYIEAEDNTPKCPICKSRLMSNDIKTICSTDICGVCFRTADLDTLRELTKPKETAEVY